MTYQSRGRSIFEVVLAICFVAFLVGFITVLCIGNYFRAKRAQERQRQRREAKQAAAASAGGSNTMDGRGMHGGNKVGGGGNGGGNVDYEAPVLPQAGGAPGRLL
mmetsp:Transcript_20912/g.31693  ORF Transcript_20912/g.31693 Transcript_20912/m.31693 type:complete len:105 (+) Transcript_20912:60-374(+)|eukprot:CAMPEP_0196149340 /NCGR_PEP_ID=MMETSP0910-20130528/29626_1 /TAXON_ID=49265 /ORGANISM="Thalassiosira rotula, Strain GSO102" /LENGTH=104 /DNA_ID=CAMNT_0041412231 /DNA_START=66 /DNA_END=380 /DNA_ORIENTATION=-